MEASHEEAAKASWKGYEVLSKRITIVRWKWVIYVRDTKPICVRNPNFSEAYPEAAIRDAADELTLRADEVGIEGLHQY